ncbi:MAG: pyridoxamine 5'-phosphate oxidase family protein [Myxococcota bacterium]
MDGRNLFHLGEFETQRALGTRSEASSRAREMFRASLTRAQAAFLGRVSFLAVAARDAADRPWATLVFGKPGFAFTTAPDALAVTTHRDPRDPAYRTLSSSGDVGLLAIDPRSGRRLRVNGLARATEVGFDVAITQVFPNCPRFVSLRELWASPSLAPGVHAVTDLHDPAIAWIASARSFFLATGYGACDAGAPYGMDVSHRGGERGFVRIEGPRDLSFPDYTGNDLFSSIGNLVKDPMAGLVFVSLETGDLVQLSGTAAIEWRAASAPSDGATRRIRIHIDNFVCRPGVIARVRMKGASMKSTNYAKKFVTER